MAQLPTLELLLEKIQNLSNTMTVGFSGTHRRLDIVNGKLAKHEERADRHKGFITNLEKADIKVHETLKTTKLFWITLTTTISVILGLAGFIIGKYF